MLQTTARLLAALVLAGLCVVVGQLPAHACRCTDPSTAAQTKNADAVFAGTLLDVSSAPSGDSRRAPALIYEVAVERVYKGDVATARVRVRSNRLEASCGLGRLSAERRYVFFTRSGAAAQRADLCGGTAPAGDRLVARVERLLGEGRDPVPAAPEPARFTKVADGEPEPLTRTAAPGLALVLAGLLGLLLVRRLGARS